MRFNYDEEKAKKPKKTAMLIFIMTIILLIFGIILFNDYYSDLSYFERKELDSNPMVPIIIGCVVVAFVTIEIYAAVKYIAASESLQTNYLEIVPDRISGMICNDLKDKNNVKHFSVSPNEIERAEKASDDSPYTVFIHTKNDTYRLCIENSDLAISQINMLINQNSQNALWQCPRCAKKVYFGQAECTCGQKFDWTKL